jgi:hypothetical protein
LRITKPRPLDLFFSWVGTRWAVRALAIHCPAAAKGGGWMRVVAEKRIDTPALR